MADHQFHETTVNSNHNSSKNDIQSTISNSASTMESRSPPQRDPSSSSSSSSSARRPRPVSVIPSPSNRHHPRHSHSHSLSETLRGVPTGSPRSHHGRPPSLTQAAIQSLIDSPPVRNPADPAFAGRDWRHISIGELVSPDDLKFVDMDTGIEEATDILMTSEIPVLLIRETPNDTSAVTTFDYSDLNAYLLLASGLAQPDEEQITWYYKLARKAREGNKIPMRDVKNLGKKEPVTKLAASANMMTAVEAFGGGIHRVVVVDNRKEGEKEEVVVGIFSQFRLVKFLWENGRSFPVIDRLYPQYLRDLRIGSTRVISINGDKPLCEALQLMHVEGITSVAVIDNHSNVIGNISTADVKLLTRSSALPLLRDTCIHFISVILSTRGLADGKDSFPVFHVNPSSTLAHTVAKMVATKSHRLWITDPLSPSPSAPQTPSHSSMHLPLAATTVPIHRPTSANSNSNNKGISSSDSSPARSAKASTNTTPQAPNFSSSHLPSPPQPYGSAHPAQATAPISGALPLPSLSPGLPLTLTPSIPASSVPGSRLSGGLVGVVSLTDVLNLYARASGLRPADPEEKRSRRRGSSSSSVGVRKSGEMEVIGREPLSFGKRIG